LEEAFGEFAEIGVVFDQQYGHGYLGP
jgi:hypothetical protein